MTTRNEIGSARPFSAIPGSDGENLHRPLQWTNIDAPEIASRAFEGSGMDLYRQMQVPIAHPPLPPAHGEPSNALDPVKPWAPSTKPWDTVDKILFCILAMILAGAALGIVRWVQS
jgi:hypothetical protein